MRDPNNSEIRYKKVMYFPDRGCVHTLSTLYVYATVFDGFRLQKKCVKVHPV